MIKETNPLINNCLLRRKTNNSSLENFNYDYPIEDKNSIIDTLCFIDSYDDICFIKNEIRERFSIRENYDY